MAHEDMLKVLRTTRTGALVLAYVAVIVTPPLIVGSALYNAGVLAEVCGVLLLLLVLSYAIGHFLTPRD